MIALITEEMTNCFLSEVACESILSMTPIECVDKYTFNTLVGCKQSDGSTFMADYMYNAKTRCGVVG